MRRSQKLKLLALAVMLFVGLALFPACQKKETFKDGIGRIVDLEKTPQRLVSLSPAHTENVFALGLGDNLLGRTDYCNKPEEALKVESLGDAFSLNLEKLVSLEPDLVLCAGTEDFVAEQVKEVERLGIPTYVSGPSSVRGVLDDLLSLADVLGVKSKGEELVARLEDELSQVSSRVGDYPVKPGVFFCVDKDLWTAGRGSFIDDVINIAGGVNAVDSALQYLQISAEEVLALDPYLIVVAFPEEEAGDLERIPGWDTLTAVSQGRVFYVDPDLVSRPSVSVIQGITELSSAFGF